MPLTFWGLTRKFQGDKSHTRNDTPDPAVLRAAYLCIILNIYFCVLFYDYIFSYCEQVAPHYCDAIPEFALPYLEVKLGT